MNWNVKLVSHSENDRPFSKGIHFARVVVNNAAWDEFSFVDLIKVVFANWSYHFYVSNNIIIMI